MEGKNTAQPLFRQLPAVGPLALMGTSAHSSHRHLPAASHPSPWVHPKVPSWCAWLTSCSCTDLGVLASRRPSLLPQPRPEALSLSPNPCALCPENPCCLSRLSSLLPHAAAAPPCWLLSGPQASLAPHPVKPSQSPLPAATRAHTLRASVPPLGIRGGQDALGDLTKLQGPGSPRAWDPIGLDEGA